ncbi:MAG: hypothetical protein A2315_00990 [Ignavibacteria bacterium RIFOXYB2_FULL_35_12]|nr:MAG: hypothetical protein A2058_16495 [Ignavibacteria bacterium GWA2_36_19]OGU49629.1 MAG: hypothetical protein A2006_02610 [Ignavibacteria bacterium GWC2_35_8]OGU62213.1 MAG: hypothetical protein A2X60_04180 [Ignavibacteria bacterium GWF2_35_20]OGU84619.1 MAG: hypothetical protein A3K31_09310 [Ignavibacteria bacterium RIFOXYA12_FULL_35_25]OGU96889.1 MAG: hypothetical protein A2347_14675 [Ignavibacteria bacterium RIFOXYB12_FULL_35_14]OGV00599.1 MAG: hypothetical protein A2455_10360 [Ignavib
MSLKSISIELADEIIKIYSDLLIKREKVNIHYYPYSALKGYDIFDIENSLKLLTAHRVYKTENLTENKLAEFKSMLLKMVEQSLFFLGHLFQITHFVNL